MNYSNRIVATVTASIVVSASVAMAMYSVADKGLWPSNWPKELEPLRKQSQTLIGSLKDYRHYAIPFTKREEFESAWPHILEVKSKGAPIVLRRGPSLWLGKEKNAGVCIHTPPEGEEPLTGDQITPLQSSAAARWHQTIYVELIVDGKIVDLNRISLPPDTPIIDERFQEPVSK